MSDRYAIGDEIEVRVEKIVPRGFGLGFAEKLTVLVPLAAPGDVLRVRLREIKKQLAFAEIVLLWLAIAATIAAFRPVSRVAAGLLVPYLAWVSFAAVLNFTLWRLNS